MRTDPKLKYMLIIEKPITEEQKERKNEMRRLNAKIK